MRTLSLTEYTTTRSIALSPDERDALRTLVRTLGITPSAGMTDCYDLTPEDTVGVLRLGDLQVEFAPRLPVERVLFLASYALDPRSWLMHPTAVTSDDHLLEAVVPTLTYHIRRVLRRGLLHGYRTIDDTHTTIRGRIRFSDQLRTRQGRPLPVEITYDDFTADVLENRLLRSAIERLLRVPLRRADLRRDLMELRGSFATVTPVAYRPGRVPEPSWTRLNSRYQPAVSIARLILEGASVDVTVGSVTATGVLFDMASVFENFVVVALREALGATSKSLPQGAAGRLLHLDEAASVSLKPDLSWWSSEHCVFVGDCKYKRALGGVPNDDLYQLLAYTTALDLRDGMLIYAAGEHPGAVYTVRHAGKRLHVTTLDLAGTPTAVLAQIGALANTIRGLAVSSRTGEQSFAA